MGAGLAMPPAIDPMLATPGPVPAGAGWAAEAKHDGMRAAITCAGGRWRVRSRNGRDVTSSYPELSVLPELLGGRRAALDGELVVLNEAGVSDFSLLQQRIGVRDPGSSLLRAAPATLYVFDLLILDQQDVMAAPYTERRAMLEDLEVRGPGIDTPPFFPDAAADLYAAAQEHGLEGIVCKRLTSPYTPGQRARTWVKTVIPHEADVVVCGWVPGRGQLRDTIGALLVGAYDRAGRLHLVGRVGSGLSGASRQQLQQQLAPLRRSNPPTGHAESLAMAETTWVDPQVVARVAYRSWTSDTQLRHPVYRGVLDDRDASAARMPITAEQQ
ncbi:ATP-dependent DNA ligase [Actinoplanes ianthinogenes]|uniref:DNA ligase (ATP) n=1 Tax=Actinoplanes ianthinogenes TaxID=122358 RepID=A0ABN6CQQ6_9ACTN|nr:non-homologous end-joining DNA ligase [Actinoplanes ianthinogenes]BCJ47550.1 ATP-dependent DNA ligase [Actinoplanes ianthinogenes]GGR02535.1 ATP-dependent DNA ligase [Actinoplanes ianthinogenes]